MQTFIDGRNVEIRAALVDRKITIEVDAEEEEQRYAVTFDECVHVNLSYSNISNWSESDMANLTSGIKQVSTMHGGKLAFEVGFADDSIMTIECNEVSIIRIPGYGSAYGYPKL